MSGPFLRDDDSTVGLALSEICWQRPRRRPGQYATVEIEAPIVTWTPNHGLTRQKRDGAPFVRALRAERVQLILRLQNDDALAAHRDDDKFVLLELGRLIARQARRPCGTRLRQRFEITNDRVSNTGQPAKQACAQKKIEKMAARRARIGRYQRLFVHSGLPRRQCIWQEKPFQASVSVGKPLSRAKRLAVRKLRHRSSGIAATHINAS
jgi:hypothetical protein